MKYFEQQNRGRCVWIWLGNSSNAKQRMRLPDLLNEWEKVWKSVEENEGAEAVVLCSRGKDFTWNVDLRFFYAIQDLGIWEKYGRRLQAALQKVAECSKPTLAAIEGNCTGLGLELALACDYRLAAAQSKGSFAMPMVKLGLLPIGGGTQRLPRLIGIRKGLEMMVTGDSISTFEAEKLGLIDKLVHPHQLHLAAQQQVLELVGKRIVRPSKLSALDKWMERTHLGRSMMLDQARQKVQLSAHGNYPAPLKIIGCVEMGYKYGVRAGYELEIQDTING